MERRKFSRDFKLVAVKLVRERGVAVARAARDLDPHVSCCASGCASMAAQQVTDMQLMAIWRRGKPDGLLHHSNRGCQYTSEQFHLLMAEHGITCSMTRSGNVGDNALMESFFPSLKTERSARKVYRTRDDAKADVL